MDEMRMDKAWLEVIVEQEESLVFERFSRQDALQIGLNIINLAKQKYKGAVAVSITEDNLKVFTHKMAGTNTGNGVWLFRKLNMCKATGVSSLRAALELQFGNRETTWQKREDAYVACGGCWPVKMINGEVFAYIGVSGLEHYDDHQIIVDAVSAHLGKKARTLKV